MSAQPIQPAQIAPVATRPADTDLAPDHPDRLDGRLIRHVATDGDDNAYDCVYTWVHGCWYHRCPTWGEVRAELPRLIEMYGLTRFDVDFMNTQILPFL